MLNYANKLYCSYYCSVLHLIEANAALCVSPIYMIILQVLLHLLNIDKTIQYTTSAR